MEPSGKTLDGLRTGDIVEGYEILKPLGAGGMGRVYQVRNTLSNRIDAMKILLPDLENDPDLTARFLSEIQVLGGLSHPNIAALYTALRVNDRFVMILEMVEGESLSARIQAGALPVEKAVDYISQVLEAISYAHQKGVIHRDIKPGNIILTADGIVKLLDFGIAKSKATPALTAAGSALGSAYYMSPEQVRGGSLDGRSDLYSVGITLYEMVTGQRPIRGDTDYSIMDGHLHQLPASAASVNPAVPPALSKIIAKALAKDPADRFQTAEAFLAAVREWPTGQSSSIPIQNAIKPRKPWLLVATVGGAALIALVAAGLILSSRKAAPAPGRAVVAPSVPNAATRASEEMALIPGGPALLGADRHSVDVGAFYIDKTEVSNAEYADFCRATGAPVPKEAPQNPDLPVVNVSFTAAQAYARWAGKRLPRPEEWEKAARGLTGQSLPWGEGLDASRANVGSSKAESSPLPAKSHLDGKSPYGVLNMLGNVWEWVDAPAVPKKAQFDNLLSEPWARTLTPPLSLNESYRQIRGGSYSFLSGARLEDLPQLIYDFAILPERVGRPEVGFRCARDVRTQ